MALENILLDDTMGIFRKLHEKKKGIGMAAALAASVAATPGHAQYNQHQQAIEMTPQIQQQMERQRVPEFLEETMFRRIPDIQAIIRAFNMDRNGARATSYMMDPTDNTFDYEMGVTNNLPQLDMEQIQKPEYWVLLKLGSMNENNSFWRGGSTYSRIYQGLSGNIENPGVNHLAKALQNNMWGNSMLSEDVYRHEQEREEHLLRALYIGATGSDNGVDPILNGQYQNIPEVRQKVQEWEQEYDFSPFSEYQDNAMLAYMVNTVSDIRNINNPQLTSTSLYILNDYYENRNDIKDKMFGIISNNLESSEKIQDYYIDRGEYSSYPFRIFKNNP